MWVCQTEEELLQARVAYVDNNLASDELAKVVPALAREHPAHLRPERDHCVCRSERRKLLPRRSTSGSGMSSGAGASGDLA